MADKNLDNQLQDSIAMLEQILEVMPGDALALKALYGAYLQGGERERAFEYLSLLANAAMDNADTDAAEYVVEQYNVFEGEHPEEISAQIARLHTLVSPAGAAGGTGKPTGTGKATAESDLSEELSLAWRLYEEEQLSQEEYSSVLHDLTEMSSKEVDVPVTVLHVLNDRGFIHMNRIMNYISTKSGVPCLSISGFEIPDETATILPRNIVCHAGALPFGELGDDLMVGVLNPFNKRLVETVEQVSGRRCHTYLIAPEEYDRLVDRIRSLLK
ncbi:MAG: hypothetical protein K9M45_03620 [Kiritimatiellales bacterium]|nr:hypothetical protein [Kiritimatiellales bacterium]